jgi:hypothetical protein
VFACVLFFIVATTLPMLCAAYDRALIASQRGPRHRVVPPTKQELNMSGNRVRWIANDLFAELDQLAVLDLTRTPTSSAPTKTGAGGWDGRDTNAVHDDGQCGDVDAFTELPHSTVLILQPPPTPADDAAAAAAAGTDSASVSSPVSDCSRDASRRARARIGERVLEGLRARGDGLDTLLLSCPLLPHVDV